MKKRLILMGLSAAAAIFILALGAMLWENSSPRALKQTSHTRQSHARTSAVVIPHMQPIAQRIGGTQLQLAPQTFPTLPSQKQLGNNAQPTMAAQTPMPTPAPRGDEGNVLYQDNFVDCANMPVGDNERFDYHCGLGEYWMIRKVTDAVGMAFVPGEYDNATFAVDGRISTFSKPVEYGLLFRMSADGKNGYGAGVYEGQYTLFRYDDGNFVELVPYTANANILAGDAVNRIQVSANGDQIALSVNGAQVATITDATHTRGSSGLYVYGAALPIESAFDNFLITGKGAATNPQSQNTPPAFPTTMPTAAPTETPAAQASDNPCQLRQGEAGLLLSNGYGIVMRFTIGGGEWGTHDYDVPGDGRIYLITFPPGTYTYTASIQGLGSDHGEPYAYQAGYCRQIDYAP
jgi:hypothetical protein